MADSAARGEGQAPVLKRRVAVRWASAAAAAGVLVLAVQTTYRFMRVARDDPVNACAEAAPERKVYLDRDPSWQWLLPGWICEFRDGGGPVRVP